MMTKSEVVARIRALGLVPVVRTSSAEDALRAVDAVRAAGGTVAGVLALVDREEGGREALEEFGLRVISLARASEIVPHIS